MSGAVALLLSFAALAIIGAVWIALRLRDRVAALWAGLGTALFFALLYTGFFWFLRAHLH